MNENTSAEPGGDAPDDTVGPTESPPESAPGGRPWWQVVAPVGAVLVVIVGVLVYQGLRGEDYADEAALTSRECGFEVEAGSAQYLSGDDFFIFESAEAPERYVVYESEPDAFYCGVDDRFWQDPSEWSTEPVFGFVDNESGRVIGTTVLGCDIVEGTLSFGESSMFWVNPLCFEPEVLIEYCGLTGDEIFVERELGGIPGQTVRITYPTAYGPATFETVVTSDSGTSLQCPSGERFDFTEEEWSSLGDSADGLLASRLEDRRTAGPRSSGGPAISGPRSTTTSPSSTISAPRSTTTAATAPAIPDEATGAACDSEDPATAEEAAWCLYEAYKAGDEELALRYGSQEAVSSLFDVAWEPPDWQFSECDWRNTIFTCSWVAPGVAAEMLMQDGDHDFVVDVLFHEI